MFTRNQTKKIKVGNLFIGGGSRVTIQSMLNVASDDFPGCIKQALALKDAGCDIIRIAIPDINAVSLISMLKEKVGVPIVADIHFDYKLALESVAAGADKIRINPGNIGSDDKVKQIVSACRLRNIPIRVGVNSGSLEKNILKKHNGPTAKALVESGLYHVELLEKFDFDDIVLSIKSSNVKTMFDAYKIAAKECRYPLHLGVTEAGTKYMGIINSAAGIGGLLLEGIGDTIRVSLTDNPVEEVYAGYNILKAVGLVKDGVKFISCPTCGRTKIDLISLANEVQEKLKDCDKNITVAIMGCIVNGPGEAKEADIGIAGGDGCGIIFKKGEIIKKVSEDMLLSELFKEINLI